MFILWKMKKMLLDPLERRGVKPQTFHPYKGAIAGAAGGVGDFLLTLLESLELQVSLQTH